MPKYRGRLYLSALMDDENSVNPLWPDIGSVDIPFQGSPSYGAYSNYQVYTVEGESVPYFAWQTQQNTTNCTNLWEAFGGTMKGCSGSVVYAPTGAIVTPTANIEGLTFETGKVYNTTTKQFTDKINQNSNTVVNNPFIIGKIPNSSNFIALCFTNNDQQAGLDLCTYTETRNAAGERTSWSYGRGYSIFSGTVPGTTNTPFYSSGATSAARPVNSQFNRIGFASGKWGSTKGRFVFLGMDDSGDIQTPPNTSTRYFVWVFISETCFSAPLEEVPEYGPEPESTGADGFKKSEVGKSGTSQATLSDYSPYGLNNAQTGHVILDKTTYFLLLGSIFGRNFTGSFSGAPDVTDPNTQGVGYNPYEVNGYYAGEGLLSPENYQSGETQSSTRSIYDSLGISKEVREAMTAAILSAQIFPAVFTGNAGSISTIAGYGIKTTISCTEISPEIVDFDTAAVIPRPYASFIGYEPYVNVSIFAPFIGVINISPSVLFDAPIGDARPNSASVRLHYLIDSLTGLCSCEVRIGNPEYTYCVKQGCCASNIPVIGSARSGEGTKSMIAGLASITGSLISFASGNVVGGATGFAGGAIQLMRGEALEPMTAPIIGSSSANLAALLSPKTPYWTMSYKNPAMPQPIEYDDILGGMTNQHGSVGSFGGFCQFYDVNLSAVSANQAVKDQILARLRAGVII